MRGKAQHFFGILGFATLMLCAVGIYAISHLGNLFPGEKPDFGFLVEDGRLLFYDEETRESVIAQSKSLKPKITVSGLGKDRQLVIQGQKKSWKMKLGHAQVLPQPILWSSTYQGAFFIVNVGSEEAYEVWRWDEAKGFRQVSKAQSLSFLLQFSLDGNSLTILDPFPREGVAPSVIDYRIESGIEKKISFRHPVLRENWMMIKPGQVFDHDQGFIIERDAEGVEIKRSHSNWERLAIFEEALYGARRIGDGFIIETVNPETKAATGVVADSRNGKSHFPLR